ncbi:hypothetical protein BDV38DRAFT_266241 [Aspergillus pseudotamarii]|uniref:Uncharacterized protein n=1 Tax=Aspergillus pseudotamarii TaxID=132259 RepID=A0A5N6SAT2_ASPPS|nr:uncharacterized protein BDV38DRAFT_266241 [Aspergillus pseudotamarii]KAE8130790.1 hypothetical protein BDV38DRAFT_266241 [Aspergillus pseudotamarii]
MRTELRKLTFTSFLPVEVHSSQCQKSSQTMIWHYKQRIPIVYKTKEKVAARLK